MKRVARATKDAIPSIRDADPPTPRARLKIHGPMRYGRTASPLTIEVKSAHLEKAFKSHRV